MFIKTMLDCNYINIALIPITEIYVVTKNKRNKENKKIEKSYTLRIKFVNGQDLPILESFNFEEVEEAVRDIIMKSTMPKVLTISDPSTGDNV